MVSQNQNMLRDVIQFFLNCQQSLCQQSSLIRQLEEIPTVALVKGQLICFCNNSCAVNTSYEKGMNKFIESVCTAQNILC